MKSMILRSKTLALIVVMVLLGVLAACSSNPGKTASPSEAENSSAETSQPAVKSQASRTAQTEAQLEEQSDGQGAVTVIVRPLNLTTQAKTLDFEVVMDTHSVDLAFDLSKLAFLSTDTGVTVPAGAWDGPNGGHHVKGKLSFPAEVDGKLVLQGATALKLIIKDVDAPERSFSWQLPQ